MEWGNSETAASVRHTTELLDTMVEFVEQDLPRDLGRCVPDALLNIALSRLFAREGREGALRFITALAAALAASADGPVWLARRKDTTRPKSDTTTPRAANVVQIRQAPP